MALLDDLQQAFPWLRQLGLSPAWLRNTAAEAASSAELVQAIRGTKQWQRRFPAIYRSDGTLRATEAEYIAREADYRKVLRDFGMDDGRRYINPQTLVGFFEGEISPDELQDRLTIYNHLRGPGGRRTRESFYVYAGLDISTDDLYEAVVDPAAEQRLQFLYNNRAAALAPDYQGWITRATQVGLNRVANTLKRLQDQGAVTGTAVQRLLAIDPGFAREVMNQIYRPIGARRVVGGNAEALPLQDLLEAFEFAAVGAAAQSAGLELPTLERLQEIRNIGVERSQAIQAYQSFGPNARIYAAAVKRARGVRFGQRQFEEATFFGDPRQTRNLEAGLAFMEARGQQEGSFRFTEESGRIRQLGLSDPAA